MLLIVTLIRSRIDTLCIPTLIVFCECLIYHDVTSVTVVVVGVYVGLVSETALVVPSFHIEYFNSLTVRGVWLTRLLLNIIIMIITRIISVGVTTIIDIFIVIVICVNLLMMMHPLFIFIEDLLLLLIYRLATVGLSIR